MNIVRNRWTHATVVVLAAVGVVLLLWWRGPAWGAVGDVFRAVEWKWVAAAVGLNLLSVLARALAWRTVIVQAFDPPYPSFMLVFSAFSVGLFANAILPGRIGELARVGAVNGEAERRTIFPKTQPGGDGVGDQHRLAHSFR